MKTTSPSPSELLPEDVRIGATVKALREARGMSQEQLAQAAMLSRPYLANIEAGRKRPSIKAVARLAAELHVPQIALIATASDPIAA